MSRAQERRSGRRDRSPRRNPSGRAVEMKGSHSLGPFHFDRATDGIENAAGNAVVGGSTKSHGAILDSDSWRERAMDRSPSDACAEAQERPPGQESQAQSLRPRARVRALPLQEGTNHAR